MLIRKNEEDWDNANYGQFSVPSKGNYIYEWYFKIQGSHIIIGIIDATEKNTTEGIRWNMDAENYSWVGFNGHVSNNMGGSGNAFRYGTGDTVALKVNTKEGTIQFGYKKNEESEIQIAPVKFALTQSDDLYYKMAATIHSAEDFVVLQKLQISNA